MMSRAEHWICSKEDRSLRESSSLWAYKWTQYELTHAHHVSVLAAMNNSFSFPDYSTHILFVFDLMVFSQWLPGQLDRLLLNDQEPMYILELGHLSPL